MPLISNLVGREKEMASLKGHLREAVAARSCWVVLTGEGGTGKTRLAAELCGYARLAGVKVLRGRCMEGGAPYEGYRGIFEALVDRYRGKAGRQMPKALRSAAPTLVPVFPVMRELVAVDSMAGASLAPAEERQRVFKAAGDVLLHAFSEAPGIVFLDDLHAADEATIHLTLALALAMDATGPDLQADARLMLLTTHREEEIDAGGTGSAMASLEPHPLWRALERMKGSMLPHRIWLGPLGRADIAEMARAMLPSPPTEDLVGRLLEESGGNPFFVEELLKAAGDPRGSVPLAQSTVLPTLAVAVAQRTARLSSRALEVALTAAVLGRESALDVLISACGLPEVEVLDAIEELVRWRIVSEEEQLGREVVRFRQEIARQLMYETLPVQRRKEIHLAAARALEDVLEAPSEIVGRHFLVGGDPATALRYLERAAREAALSYANLDALRLYDLALDAVRDVPGATRDHFRLLSSRVGVLDHIGRRDEERRTIEEAEGIARRSGDAGTICDAFLQWADYYNVTAEGETAHDVANRALGLARQRSDHFREARALRAMARSFEVRGDHERCFEILEEVLPLTQELGDVPMEATVLGTMGVCQMALGDFVVSRRRLLDAAERWRRMGDRRSLASTLVHVARVDEGMGRFQDSLHLLTEVLRIRREIGHRYGEAEACAALVSTRRLLGDLDGARREAASALALSREIETLFIAGHAHLQLAIAEIDGPGPDALVTAERNAAAAELEARALGDPVLEARALAVRAEIARRKGRHTEALRLSEEALERLALRGYGSFGGEEEVLWSRSRALSDADQAEAAADALAKAHSRVLRKAERIENAELRRSFLAVPLHREIVDAWRTLQARGRPI